MGVYTLPFALTGEFSDKLEFVAEPGLDLAFECGYGIGKGDVAVGVVDGVVSALLDGPTGIIRGRYWVRQLVEPPGDDKQGAAGPTPPDSSG